jgi:hypothetical protein
MRIEVVGLDKVYVYAPPAVLDNLVEHFFGGKANPAIEALAEQRQGRIMLKGDWRAALQSLSQFPEAPM